MNKLCLMIKYFIVQCISPFIKPNKNHWLFSSSYNMKFNYNSKYLFEYVIKNHPNIKSEFVINDDEKRKELIQQYGNYFVETKTLLGMINALRSGVWYTSAGLPVYLLKRNENRLIINLWHGVPLKKIGLLENKVTVFKKIYFQLLFSNKYTAILTTSTYLTEIMAKSFAVSKNKIKVLGQPRNDLLSNEFDKHQYLNKKYTTLPKYKKIILYAPTYREYGKTELFPFKDFTKDCLEEYLDERQYIIFIRMHQSEINENLIVELNKISRIKFINDDVVEDIMEALNIFDLLITDYSSMYIDHLLIEKPQLFIPYDISLYNEKRGLNFEYNKFTPGPKPDSFKEFKFEIDKLLIDSNYFKVEREEINKIFNQVQNNNCERIVKYTKEIICEK